MNAQGDYSLELYGLNIYCVVCYALLLYGNDVLVHFSCRIDVYA